MENKTTTSISMDDALTILKDVSRIFGEIVGILLDITKEYDHIVTIINRMNINIRNELHSHLVKYNNDNREIISKYKTTFSKIIISNKNTQLKSSTSDFNAMVNNSIKNNILSPASFKYILQFFLNEHQLNINKSKTINKQNNSNNQIKLKTNNNPLDRLIMYSEDIKTPEPKTLIKNLSEANPILNELESVINKTTINIHINKLYLLIGKLEEYHYKYIYDDKTRRVFICNGIKSVIDAHNNVLNNAIDYWAKINSQTLQASQAELINNIISIPIKYITILILYYSRNIIYQVGKCNNTQIVTFHISPS